MLVADSLASNVEASEDQNALDSSTNQSFVDLTVQNDLALLFKDDTFGVNYFLGRLQWRLVFVK